MIVVEREVHADLPPGNEPFRREVTAGADGRFEASVRGPGRYLVVAATERSAPCSAEVVLGEGAPHIDLDLWLTPPASIRVELVTPAGDPIPECYLRAVSSDEPTDAYVRHLGDASPAERHGLADAKTDERGVAELFPLTDGVSYRLTLRGLRSLHVIEDVVPEPGLQRFVVDDGSLETADLLLDVSSPRAGAVDDLTLRVDQHFGDGRWRSGKPTTHRGPGVALTGLPVDVDLYVSVHTGGHGWTRVGPIRPAEVRGVMPVRIPAPAELALRVVDPSGAPIANARVDVMFSGESGRRTILVEERTDGDGRAEVSGLAPGPYLVHASSSKAASTKRFAGGRSERIELEEGERRVLPDWTLFRQ